MIYSIIKKNSYQDSVNLMLLSKYLNSIDEIEKVTVMMGTEANKEIMRNSNLITQEVEKATSSDICCVVVSKINLEDLILSKIDEFFKLKNNENHNNIDIIHSFNSLKYKDKKPNIALISIPGNYIYKEVKKMLDKDMNIMIFSDNVSLEEEKKLKEIASSKNLLIMGADCGTSIIQGVGFAFANKLKEGNIGIIGASGTGIQEITTNLSNSGLGISNAIGLGGRDLSLEIGGISAIQAIDLLNKDKKTEIIVFVSKPPAKKVMEKIIKKFESIKKPVVACFLGEDLISNNGVFYEKTLSRTVEKVKIISKILNNNLLNNYSNNKILALYCGGTLATEASIIISENKKEKIKNSHHNGIIYESNNIKVIDLGDDYYTNGKPHPMIEPIIRNEILDEILLQEDYQIILLDNVIGYGASEKMAYYIKKMKDKYKDKIFVTSITGTELDFQNIKQEIKILKEVSILAKNNEEAINISLAISNLINKNKIVEENIPLVNNILNDELVILNVGLQKFLKPFEEANKKVIQFNWKPIAGGNKNLEKMLEELE